MMHLSNGNVLYDRIDKIEKNYLIFFCMKVILLSSCDAASQTYIDLFAGFLRKLFKKNFFY
jgi:hypothetical protein